ncbi:hypothetical protein [Maribacter antarcticus]|uniref:hypothetical protein n=1 Tax=Maribacter antarcticus TaxID=505250 RepID=UPI00047C6BA2|nr:hypothetical protein [Maribacter antarcticus]
MGNKYFGITCILLLFYSIPILAQKHFEEGFIVLNNGDTITGLIKDRKPDPFGKIYKKIRHKGKGKSRYGPHEILAYKKGEMFFESIGLASKIGFLNQDYNISSNEKERVFIRVINQGYVNHYVLEFQDADSGYYDHFSYFKKRNGTELVRTTQGIFGLRKKRLAVFFSDCPILAVKIRNKELKSAHEVATFYNEWKRNQKTF